jgi:translation initiation factor 1
MLSGDYARSMSGLFAGTHLDRPVTCERCELPLAKCTCPRTASGRVMLPGEQAARVRREKRRGKHVTVVSGLDPVASDLPALLKKLKTRFAAGGTINDAELELQGDHREAVVELLKSMGYPAKPAGG